MFIDFRNPSTNWWRACTRHILISSAVSSPTNWSSQVWLMPTSFLTSFSVTVCSRVSVSVGRASPTGSSTPSLNRGIVHTVFEPRHEKMGFRESPTRQDTNWPAQLQIPARILKFRIYKLEVSFCLASEQQMRWSDCADAQADLRLCCSHIA